MKAFCLSLALLVFAVLAAPQPAHAVPLYGSYSRTLFSQTPVSTSAWTQLFAQGALPKAVKLMIIYNTSQNPIVVGTGLAGSEIAQMVVPPGASNSQGINLTALPKDYALSVSQGQRVAIECLNSQCSTGEFTVDILFF